MNIISKIAMIWAIPIFMIMVALMAIKTSVVYFCKVVFVKSGTADALAFLFARLRLFMIDYTWKTLKNDDAKLSRS
jgi:hypothetical protein